MSRAMRAMPMSGPAQTAPSPGRRRTFGRRSKPSAVEFRETRDAYFFDIGVITGAERIDLLGEMAAEEIRVFIVRFFDKQRIGLCPHQIIRSQRRRAGKLPGLGRVKKIERLPGDEGSEDDFLIRVVRIGGRAGKAGPGAAGAISV